MTFLKYSFIALLTVLLIGSAGYLLAASAIQSKPGYAELTLPNRLVTDPTLALKLGPNGLKPVRWVVKRVVNASDIELELSERLLMSVLQDVQGVQLHVYEVDNNRHVFEQAIDESIASLKQEDWQVLVKVREDDKHIVVMQSAQEDLISGLLVLASTPENAVFINLVGLLNPESIAVVAENLN